MSKTMRTEKEIRLRLSYLESRISDRECGEEQCYVCEINIHRRVREIGTLRWVLGERG